MSSDPSKLSAEELAFLVQYLDSNPQIKYIVTSDTTTKLDKEVAWTKICDVLNSTFAENYSVSELKCKWNKSKKRLINKCYKLKTRENVWMELLSDDEKRVLALTQSKLAKKIKVRVNSKSQEPSDSLHDKSPHSRNQTQQSLSTSVGEPSPSSESPDRNGCDTEFIQEMYPLPYILSTSTVKDEVEEFDIQEVPKNIELMKEKTECNNSHPIVEVSRLETNSTPVLRNSKKRKLSSSSSNLPPIKLKTSKKKTKANSQQSNDSEQPSDLVGVLQTMNNHLSKLVSTNEETLQYLKSLDQKQDKVITLLSAALNVDEV